MSPVLWLVIGVVIGFIIGFLVKHFLAAKTTSETSGDALADTQQAFHEYRTQMSAHFQKTAQLLSHLQSQHDALQQHVYAATQHVNQEQQLAHKKTETPFIDPSIAAARQTQQK